MINNRALKLLRMIALASGIFLVPTTVAAIGSGGILNLVPQAKVTVVSQDEGDGENSAGSEKMSGDEVKLISMNEPDGEVEFNSEKVDGSEAKVIFENVQSGEIVAGSEKAGVGDIRVFVHPFEGSLLVVWPNRATCIALDKNKRHAVELETKHLLITPDGLMVDVPENTPYRILRNRPHFNRTCASVILDSGERLEISVAR